MTATETGSVRPEVTGPRPGSLDGRASFAFKLLAVLNVPGLVLAALPSDVPSSSLLAAASAAATAAISVLFLVEANGLDRRKPWASAAVRPMLVVVLAFGIYSMLVAFDQGWLKAPLDAVLATWAWFGPPDDTPARGIRLRSVALVAAAVGLLSVVWYGPPVLGWGGVLDVHQRDFHAALDADCGAPRAGAPPTITVTYDWSWARTSPFPSGLDVVVVGWTGVDADGRIMYLLDATPESGVGIHEGRQGDPSLAMAMQVESESPGSWHWGIQLAQQQLEPGRIVVRLIRARQSQPGPLTITASYIHLGLWRQDAARVSCSW